MNFSNLFNLLYTKFLKVDESIDNEILRIYNIRYLRTLFIDIILLIPYSIIFYFTRFSQYRSIGFNSIAMILLMQVMIYWAIRFVPRTEDLRMGMIGLLFYISKINILQKIDWNDVKDKKEYYDILHGDIHKSITEEYHLNNLSTEEKELLLITNYKKIKKRHLIKYFKHYRYSLLFLFLESSLIAITLMSHKFNFARTTIIILVLFAVYVYHSTFLFDLNKINQYNTLLYDLNEMFVNDLFTNNVENTYGLFIYPLIKKQLEFELVNQN